MSIRMTMDEMKARGYVPPPDPPQPTEEELAARNLQEVTSWFVDAKRRGSCGVNLWYSPYNDLFRQMSTKELVHGHDVGIIRHENDLYKLQSGSGDCELNLHYIGPVKV